MLARYHFLGARLARTGISEQPVVESLGPPPSLLALLQLGPSRSKPPQLAGFCICRAKMDPEGRAPQNPMKVGF